ncbi:uncharacterized protein LOC110810642 [Carica papaya]|uniref:uncharacterized protein LOC110810642 n=1 Tax=Carica papaya TaxID=3649 RepID=UPI000B8C9B49|nr:uncharacterized protein LOC110810642 [Carica papaya]
MAVDTNLSSLLERLKMEDHLLLPPRTWESIPSESGAPPPSRFSSPLPSSSSVSEKSLVRLALTALQGVESSLISIEKFSTAFCSDPADRTFHQIRSLWNRSSSTHALGKILKSIGRSGTLVFLLHKFVDYFTNLNFDEKLVRKRQENHELEGSHCDGEHQEQKCLVNQAFAVAVGKVLEGYTCALDTLCASVCLRCSAKKIDLSLASSTGLGCLTNVVHSELTLLEVYLHSKELRTQIEALGNICKLHHIALCFSIYSFEDLVAKGTSEIFNFYSGGDLLTYLYLQLKVADPAQLALLKFLFLRSCEPYCMFIRSWIFKAEISDPHKEFIVEFADDLPPCSHNKAGISPLASVKERDGAAVPCFLKDSLTPLIRAGQQLQVLIKLLELCNYAATEVFSYTDLLPCWTGILSNNLFYASAMTFSKGSIEGLVLARKSYYNTMQEKFENLLRKLKFCCGQVTEHTVPILSGSYGDGLDDSVSFTPNCSAASDVELQDHTDASESSECSSINGFEEKIEAEELLGFPNSFTSAKQSYLSALSFSMSTPINNSMQKCPPIEKLSSTERHSNDVCKGTDAYEHLIPSEKNKEILSNIAMPPELEESDCSCIDVEYTDSLPGKCWPLGGLSRNPFHVDEGFNDPGVHSAGSVPKVGKIFVGFIENGMSSLSKNSAIENVFIEEDRDKKQLENDSSTLDLLASPKWKFKYLRNYFSMNPMLTRGVIFNLMGKPGETVCRNYAQSLPCFDFSTIDDPSKVHLKKLTAQDAYELFEDSNAFMTSAKSDRHGTRCYEEDLIRDTNVFCNHLPLDLKDHNDEDTESKNVSGGSGWEGLLGGSGNLETSTSEDHRQILSAMFEIPIDFVIDKCLLQEISLQYNYVSKLAIQLLEEGFDLREHLSALRRYHFMELADWADLFILSLWRHKWLITGADRRIAEIQGFLNSSVQRSSCEWDNYKDRLFVYMKGHSMMHLSTSTIGVDSFNFLGLGYRVDWPVDIILTPAALEMYSDVFSFLVQVKLAVFSLTDIWCFLKDNHSAPHEREIGHFDVLMKLRHQVNHFVSALQQYIQSQLAHVSWCRFLHSLKHKVKDMMDLEAVHMAYLRESKYICFLSDETRAVGSIIESILQCTLDFRLCLIGSMRNTRDDQSGFLHNSGINISQVLAIKQKFDRSVKELHICYLKSPKHGEFGLSPFWDYLNFNEYYSDVTIGMSHILI